MEKIGVAHTIARAIQINNIRSSTVDGRESEEHETYVVDSTIVDCKSCCCNGKIAKKSNESEVEY